MARVLVLDPSAEVRELVRRLLESAGHVAVSPPATPGREADVDVVVFEPADPAARKLAQGLRDERSGLLRLVAVSILPRAQVLEEAQVDAYLAKPFGRSELLRTIEGA